MIRMAKTHHLNALFATSDREYLTEDNGDRRFMPLDFPPPSGPALRELIAPFYVQQFGRAKRPITVHRRQEFHAGRPIKTLGGARYVCRQCSETLGVCSCFRPVLSREEAGA
jgi:hypothetical protein